MMPGIKKNLLSQVFAGLAIMSEPPHKQINLLIIPVHKLGGRRTVAELVDRYYEQI